MMMMIDDNVSMMMIDLDDAVVAIVVLCQQKQARL
jgi:hypothetical protein